MIEEIEASYRIIIVQNIRSIKHYFFIVVTLRKLRFEDIIVLV